MQLYHKFIITFSIVSLAVLATGVAGLFIVDKVGKDIELVLEGKVGVADASSEVVNIVMGSEALLHEHMLTLDLARLDQIREEMEEYHKLDNMWMGAIIQGTESREFIESEEYSIWRENGYDEKGIIIRKAEPDVVPIIEELDANHKKFHMNANYLMELHREKIDIQRNITNLYSKEKSHRHMMRNIVDAQGDYQVLGDMWVVEYESKEAIFQYRDKKHIDEWMEAIETLKRTVANSTIAPEIKSEIQNQSAKYLSLAKPLSKETLRLTEIDATILAQTNILDEHIVDMNANVDKIKANSLAARVDAKREIRAYVTGMSNLLAVAMVIAIVLVLFAGYFTNMFMSRPIVALRDATRKAGEGDFDVRIKVDRGDEIGELNVAFNEMAEALKKRTHDIGERVKELNCLYEVSRLSTAREKSLSEILQDSANLIPPAWQYPGITCARITYEGQEFTTENFKKTGWGQFADITASGTKVGSIEVYYLEERPEIDEGPFLKEERPLIDALGKQLGNITEKEQLHQTLKESEEKFRVALKGSSITTFIQDRDLRYTWIYNPNPNFTEEVVQGMIGKTDYDLVPKEDAEPLMKLKQSVIDSREGAEEVVRFTVEGVESYYTTVLEPVLDEEGKVIGISGASHDITELIKAEGVIKEHVKELERTNRFKETVTDILRHDLLNPIGVIGNIIEILVDDKNLRDSSEFHVIKRNVKKLKEIVYNASDYAKLESTEKLEKTELDLAKVIESVIEDLSPYIKDKGMNVEFKPKGRYKASASPIIESVFVNLLSNAIKYSPDGLEIKIAIEDGGKSWKVSFADRGDGVPDEYKETIFDRFTRKDKKGVKGTGFGLAIVKRIVEMHEGRVWMEDNPRGGSVFYVEMPK